MARNCSVRSRVALHADVSELAVLNVAAYGTIEREADLISLLICLAEGAQLGELAGGDPGETLPGSLLTFPATFALSAAATFPGPDLVSRPIEIGVFLEGGHDSFGYD